MPDELLARVDAEAERRGSTRSAVLRSFAETVLGDQVEESARARRALLADAPQLVANRGGNVAELIKRSRP